MLTIPPFMDPALAADYFQYFIFTSDFLQPKYDAFVFKLALVKQMRFSIKSCKAFVGVICKYRLLTSQSYSCLMLWCSW